MVLGKNSQDPDYPHDTDAEQSDQGRGKGVAVAPQGTGQVIDRHIEKFKTDYIQNTDLTVMDNSRVTVEDRQQRTAEKDDQSRYDYGRNRRLQIRHACGPAAALHIAGAVVLSDKGRGSLAEASEQAEHHGFKVQRGRRGRHDVGTQRVDRRLDQNVRNGESHALQAGRHTDLDHIFQQIFFNGQMTERQVGRPVGAHQADHKDQRTDQVGDDGRDGDTVGIHAEDGDKENVETDVGNAADSQSRQGSTGVSLAAEDSGAEVIKQDDRHTAHVDAEIG